MSGLKYMGPALGVALVNLFVSNHRVDGLDLVVFVFAAIGLVMFIHDEARRDKHEEDGDA